MRVYIAGSLRNVSGLEAVFTAAPLRARSSSSIATASTGPMCSCS